MNRQAEIILKNNLQEPNIFILNEAIYTEENGHYFKEVQFKKENITKLEFYITLKIWKEEFEK